ncbi:MAG: VWA domain-containing protein [Acidobacteria bacterium]|nr:VWA domain-containing protein [Acidobacteriota bacterium]MBI3425229.1 VWA domain-containing protein [Acidobacteriota bacterium]
MLQPSPIRLALLFCLGTCLAALPPAAAQQTPQSPPTTKPAPQNKDNRSDSKDKQKKPPNRADSKADQPTDKDDVGIKINTDLVSLDVSVIDQNNTPVFNLDKDVFAVFEDKVKQQIDSVSREEVALSFGLVIDTSGSMRSKLQIVTDAGLGIIKTMRQDDEAFVAQFKAEPELVTDFTHDKRELEEALGELYTSSGTALLDAIIATGDYAHEKGKQRRKAIIVITDGVEKNSAVKEKEVLDAIKEDEVQVYLVGFVDEDDSGGIFGKSGAKKAKDLLQRIADDSGGRAFFPKDVSEMGEIAKQIAKDLRTQYVLSYYPSNDKRDGSFRSVKVQVAPKDNRKLIARTRQGYYAKNEKGETVQGSNRKTRGSNP